MTTTLTVSTTAELNSAIAEADAAASGGFVIDLAGNITQSASLDAIDLNSAVTLTINGGSSTDYTLNGGGTYTGLDVVSAGGGTIIENLQLSEPVSTLAGGELAGSVTIASNATVGQTGQVTFGDATNGPPPSIITALGISLAHGGSPKATPSGSTFYNYGTMERDPNGVDGISHIYVDVVDTGTLSVPDNTPDGATTDLEFDGTTNSFSGIYIGGGMIDYGAGSNTLGTIDMPRDACTTNFDGAIVHQNGVVDTLLVRQRPKHHHQQYRRHVGSSRRTMASRWRIQAKSAARSSPITVLGKDRRHGNDVIDVDFNPYSGFGSINIEFGGPGSLDAAPTVMRAVSTASSVPTISLGHRYLRRRHLQPRRWGIDDNRFYCLPSQPAAGPSPTPAPR